MGTILERIAEHAPDGYAELNERGEVIYANPQASLYLGLLPHEFAAYPSFLDLTQSVYRFEPAEAWASWPAALLNDEPARHLVRPEAGSVPALWLRVEAVAASEGNTGLLLRLRDVTQQIAFQRELWKFRSLLSHKLNTPLHGLLGSLEALANTDRLSAEETRESASMAMSCAQRLNAQVQDVLLAIHTPVLSEESGKPLVIRELPDVASRLAQTLGIYSITTQVEPALTSLRLPWNTATLRTVLTEIFENSKKFHPQHMPTMHVEATIGPNDLVVIQVADNGTTVPLERLPRVWRPYYQDEQGSNRTDDGIGLAMVASLVWEKGGECRMLPRQPETGVVVEFTLPLAA